MFALTKKFARQEIGRIFKTQATPRLIAPKVLSSLFIKNLHTSIPLNQLTERAMMTSFDQGKECFNKGLYEKAVSEYNTYISGYYSLGLQNTEKLAEAYERSGSALYHLKEYSSCLNPLLEALSIREKYLPDNKTDIMRNVNAISLAYEHLKDYQNAIKYARNFLQLALDNLEEKDLAIVNAYSRLGLLSEKAKNYFQSLAFYTNALQQSIKIFGESHPFLAPIYNSIGNTHMKLNDFQSAADNFTRGLELTIHQQGENDIAAASFFNNLSVAYRNMGQLTGSLDYALRGLEIAYYYFGSESLAIVPFSNSVAYTYKELRVYEKSLALFIMGLKLQEQYLGKDSSMITSLTNVGILLVLIGKYEKAIEDFKRALQIHKDLGIKDLNTIPIINYHMSLSYLKLQKYDEALNCLDVSTQCYLEQNEFENDQLILNYYRYATIYLEMMNLTQAREYVQKGMNISKEKKKQGDIADGLELMGEILYKEGNKNEAIAKLKEAEKLKVSIYGKNNIKLHDLFEKMENIYRSENNLKEAESYAKKISKIHSAYNLESLAL